MAEVPRQLLDGLSPADGEKVAAWWAGLAELARSQVIDLCDPRREECFFGIVPDEAVARLPMVIGGRFVPSDRAAGWAEWHAELFDYLICNLDLVIFAPPVVRTFHICTHHDVARAIRAADELSAAFKCPLGSTDCPTRRLLSLAPNNFHGRAEENAQ